MRWWTCPDVARERDGIKLDPLRVRGYSRVAPATVLRLHNPTNLFRLDLGNLPSPTTTFLQPLPSPPTSSRNPNSLARDPKVRPARTALALARLLRPDPRRPTPSPPPQCPLLTPRHSRSPTRSSPTRCVCRRRPSSTSGLGYADRKAYADKHVDPRSDPAGFALQAAEEGVSGVRGCVSSLQRVCC